MTVATAAMTTKATTKTHLNLPRPWSTTTIRTCKRANAGSTFCRCTKHKKKNNNKWKLKSNTWKWKKRIRAVTRTVSGCKVVQSGLNVHEIFIHQTVVVHTFLMWIHQSFHSGGRWHPFLRTYQSTTNNVGLTIHRGRWFNYSEHTTSIPTLFGLH